MATSTTTLVLLLAVVGVTLAYTYVAPDEQLTKTGPRVQGETAKAPRRQKPQPLTPQQAASQSGTAGQPKRAGAPRLRRGVDNNAGSGSFSSAGSGSYSGSSSGGGGGGGGQFNAFHNGNPMGIMPVDFGSLFQYVQDMQNAFQQQANFQGLTNSYGIATRSGPVGNNDYSGVSSSATFSGGFGGGYGGSSGGFGGNEGAYGGSSGGFGGSSGGFGGSSGGFGGNSVGGDGASAVASIGPQGGYGSANLSPDLGNRFGGGDEQSGGQFAAPSGGNYGVFTSSSSGSSDVNGQKTHFQQATSGVNDNGKITSFTVKNPKK